ncbi:MAG: hypothetical protein H7X95_01490 [Deltaproteobacteria bacterium]|nr:hypothetical protein [Deltaproteobacteria bacterium]
MTRVPAGGATAGVAFVIALAFGAAPSIAMAGTKVFRQNTAKDFEEGEVTGASILPAGEVVTGLIATRTAVDAAFVWCAAASRDGATAYFGTGDEGKIFAIPTAATAGATAPGTGVAHRIATLDAPWVTALAVRTDGVLVAGTTPGGRVFTVDPKSGATRVLTTLGPGHVWTMARDDKAALTYVGTGAPGKIFAVDDQGKSRQIWDARDKHVVALMRDADGTLLAGTAEEAILYRVRSDGRAEAIHDFEAEEVRAIVRAPSGLFVAVNDFEKPSTFAAAPGPTPAKGTKIVLGTGGPPASAGTLPRPGGRKAKAAVYRIESDGRIEQVFALSDGYLTALAVADDGAVLAAAGTQGHVFRLNADRSAALVIDVAERQALTLLRAGGGAVLVGTGDVGGVYRAQPPSVQPQGPAQAQSTYLSKVLDADWTARWGTLRWLGSQVRFETRSGNTAKPDAGWNDWKAVQKVQTNSEGGVGHVASPGARYLQYRAALSSATSRVRGVTTSYVPQNQRARVTELTLAEAAGAAVVIGATTPATTTRAPHSAILKLRWKTENPDGDEVIYRLSFRQVNETVWRPLISASTDSLTKAEYDWNTEGIPDGLYVLRVTVSDERSQPRDRALVSAFESAPLLVDNGRPAILELAASYPALTGKARDDASAITQIEFAVDGGDFQLVAPTDGIADDLYEPFSIHLPALPRGPHAVAVRVTDSADNVGATQITVKAP